MPTLRARPVTGRGVREGSWEAHQPSSWRTNNELHYGSTAVPFSDQWRPSTRGRPPSSHDVDMSNRALQTRLASETVGSWSHMKPLVRPRPPSVATQMLQNPCIRDGEVSSDPIGMHTGVGPARLSPRSRPYTAPIWQDPSRAARTSDAIGIHPPRQALNRNDATQMIYEAQFAHSFGERGRELGPVLATADTMAAIEYRKQAISRAHALSPKPKKDTTATDNTSLRADGVRMEKMDFDAVYSAKHVNKDTESVVEYGNLVPRIDPRCSIVRPKDLSYGLEHRVWTAQGQRPILPSRSFMAIACGIGEGRNRTIECAPRPVRRTNAASSCTPVSAALRLALTHSHFCAVCCACPILAILATQLLIRFPVEKSSPSIIPDGSRPRRCR